jgi:hypothetical protein
MNQHENATKEQETRTRKYSRQDAKTPRPESEDSAISKFSFFLPGRLCVLARVSAEPVRHKSDNCPARPFVQIRIRNGHDLNNLRDSARGFTGR